MTYTKKNFRDDMYKELIKGYDPYRIGNKAFVIYFSHMKEIDGDFYNKIMEVIVMEQGPEFHMTEAEFREFIEKL